MALRWKAFIHLQCNSVCKRICEQLTTELLLVEVEYREVNAIMGGAIKGHTIGAATQGLLFAQDLKPRSKILKRGSTWKLKFSMVNAIRKLEFFISLVTPPFGYQLCNPDHLNSNAQHVHVIKFSTARRLSGPVGCWLCKQNRLTAWAESLSSCHAGTVSKGPRNSKTPRQSLTNFITFSAIECVTFEPVVSKFHVKTRIRKKLFYFEINIAAIHIIGAQANFLNLKIESSE